MCVLNLLSVSPAKSGVFYFMEALSLLLLDLFHAASRDVAHHRCCCHWSKNLILKKVPYNKGYNLENQDVQETDQEIFSSKFHNLSF